MDPVLLAANAPVRRAYRRALGRLRAAEPAQHAGIVQAMALTEEPAALDHLDLARAAGWTPLWSGGHQSTFHLRLAGHTGPVFAVAFGEVDGRPVLASGGRDGTVRLWDALVGEPVGVLTGHSKDVEALAFGGNLLASGSDDGTVRVWDAAQGALLTTITITRGRPSAVGFGVAGNGRRVLVTASGQDDDDDGAVYVWDPVTGDRIASLHEGGPVPALAVMPGAVVAGLDEDVVRLWDLAGGPPLVSWKWPRGWRDSDLDGGRFAAPLVVTSLDGRVVLGATASAAYGRDWEYTCAGVVWWDPVTHGVVRRDELGQDETLLAADGSGRTATVKFHGYPGGSMEGPDVSIRGGRRVDLQGHTGVVRAASFGDVDGMTMLATASDDGTVLLWDAESEHAHPAASGPQGSGLAAARDVLAVGRAAGFVELLDPITGGRLRSVSCDSASRATPGHDCGGYSDHCRRAVAVGTVDGRTLVATGGDAGGVALWDADTGTMKRFLTEPEGSVLAFGQVGGRTLLAATGGPAAVWDPATGERIATLREGPNDSAWGTRSIVFGTSQRASIVATGKWSRVDIWNPLFGRRLRSLPGHGKGAGLAAGPDVLAVAHDDEVCLWEPETGRRLSTCASPDGLVTCLTLIHGDGRLLLVTGAEDGTVRLWDALEARVLSTLATFARPVTAVAVTRIAGQPHVFAQAVSGRLTACRLS